jgi:hypothetical protein
MFLTVNYGSGTPSEAADWVSRATSGANGKAVALWEVGNESYSCFETNEHLADSPTFVKGYRPDGPVCPTTAVMTKSYVAHAPAYIKAMKKSSPEARIGIPWAFSGNEAKGAGVADAIGWNNTVLRKLGDSVNFVDAHWYPFDTVAGITNTQILASIRRIPAAAAHIRATLHHFRPGLRFVVGETNISERPTAFDFDPVSALFAAATSLEWLVQGAESVDWWDLSNFGSPSTGDYGLLSSGPPEVNSAGTPLPPYYGELLSSRLTSTGSRLKNTSAGSPAVLGFQSDFQNRRRILLVNTGSIGPTTIRPNWFISGSVVHVETYSPSTARDLIPVTRSTLKAGSQISLPPLSIVVLAGSPRP